MTDAAYAKKVALSLLEKSLERQLQATIIELNFLRKEISLKGEALLKSADILQDEFLALENRVLFLENKLIRVK